MMSYQYWLFGKLKYVYATTKKLIMQLRTTWKVIWCFFDHTHFIMLCENVANWSLTVLHGKVLFTNVRWFLLHDLVAVLQPIKIPWLLQREKSTVSKLKFYFWQRHYNFCTRNNSLELLAWHRYWFESLCPILIILYRLLTPVWLISCVEKNGILVYCRYGKLPHLSDLQKSRFNISPKHFGRDWHLRYPDE